jgi:hypothetical protein
MRPSREGWSGSSTTPESGRIRFCAFGLAEKAGTSSIVADAASAMSARGVGGQSRGDRGLGQPANGPALTRQSIRHLTDSRAVAAVDERRAAEPGNLGLRQEW